MSYKTLYWVFSTRLLTYKLIDASCHKQHSPALRKTTLKELLHLGSILHPILASNLHQGVVSLSLL